MGSYTQVNIKRRICDLPRLYKPVFENLKADQIENNLVYLIRAYKQASIIDNKQIGIFFDPFHPVMLAYFT